MTFLGATRQRSDSSESSNYDMHWPEVQLPAVQEEKVPWAQPADPVSTLNLTLQYLCRTHFDKLICVETAYVDAQDGMFCKCILVVAKNVVDHLLCSSASLRGRNTSPGAQVDAASLLNSKMCTMHRKAFAWMLKLHADEVPLDSSTAGLPLQSMIRSDLTDECKATSAYVFTISGCVERKKRPAKKRACQLLLSTVRWWIASFLSEQPDFRGHDVLSLLTGMPMIRSRNSASIPMLANAASSQRLGLDRGRRDDQSTSMSSYVHIKKHMETFPCPGYCAPGCVGNEQMGNVNFLITEQELILLRTVLNDYRQTHQAHYNPGLRQVHSTMRAVADEQAASPQLAWHRFGNLPMQPRGPPYSAAPVGMRDAAVPYDVPKWNYAPPEADVNFSQQIPPAYSVPNIKVDSLVSRLLLPSGYGPMNPSMSPVMPGLMPRMNQSSMNQGGMSPMMGNMPTRPQYPS